MCLCPNIFLGLIPYIIFLIFPNLTGLGLFGIICIGMGFAIRQVPKGSKMYLYKMHSYWYLQE